MQPTDPSPRRLRRIKYSVESLGVRRTAVELLPRHRPYEPGTDMSFDDRHATDTAGAIEPDVLAIDDPASRAAAILYLPSPPRVTRWMLDRAAVDVPSTTFV